MTLELKWTRDGWKDYIAVQNDRRLLRKVNKLIEDILRTGSRGIGKLKIIKGNLQGWCTRRLDNTNRIVYRINGDVKETAQCCTHYHK